MDSEPVNDVTVTLITNRELSHAAEDLLNRMRLIGKTQSEVAAFSENEVCTSLTIPAAWVDFYFGKPEGGGRNG